MSRVVQNARKASPAQLAASVQDIHIHLDVTFVLQVSKASGLSVEERDAVWEILEKNMRDLYAGSSLGWDPPKTRKELFHSSSRFILVRGDSGEMRDNNATTGSPPVVAFTMFRFEREYDENIIYCYQLQVCSESRRSGLGSHLVRQLLSLCRNWRMEKVILTVIKVNVVAMEFYKAIGFTIDPSSPDYVSDGDPTPEDDNEEKKDVDYVIMSKVMQS